MIRAPFNFVPLADKVYFPDWADQISQDVPFEDGMDGYVTIQFRAESPIFIRNGHRRSEAPNKNNDYEGKGDYLSFSRIGETCFLPATSVKGMIRNVFEIMTFGKMRVDKAAMFAQREWGNQTLYPFIAAKGADKKGKNAALCAKEEIKCGWLCERKDYDQQDGTQRYYIKKCPGYYRINHKRIGEFIKSDILREKFEKKKDYKLPEEHKTVSYKYNLLETAGYGREKLKGLHFCVDEEYACEFQENRVCQSDSGNIVGTLVLTGQPDLTSWKTVRGIGDGKFYEFVFEEGEDYRIDIDEDTFDHYRFIYQGSEDWNFIQERLQEDGVPVFFRDIEVNGEREIKDFGLAFLYKIPYTQTPYELEQKPSRYKCKQENTPDLDMADCLFGFVDGEKNKDSIGSLKGRVQFSNFKCTDYKECRDYTLVLNSPKASYYPIYIRQDVDKQGHVQSYKTYNDGLLSGWKRYNLRDNVWEKCTGDKALDTKIYPLGSGSTFEGRINFHNVKPHELGALLSALSFMGNEKCFHQIGQGKPYGFGRLSWEKMELNIVQEDEFNRSDCTKYMALFEEHMNKMMKYNWNTQESIIHLFSIASTIIPDTDISHYMILQMEDKSQCIEGINEFQDAKDAKESLRNFVSMYGQAHCDSKLRILEAIRKQEAEKKYTEEKNSIIVAVQNAIKYGQFSDAEKGIFTLRELLNSHDEYNSPIIDELSTQLKNNKAQNEAAARVGNSSFIDYIANEKYIGPLVNKAIGWCDVTKSTPTDDEIRLLNDKIKEMGSCLKKSDEKRFNNAINRLKTQHPELMP